MLERPTCTPMRSRNAREREQREEPGQAAEREREPEADPERGENAAEQLERTVRRNRGAEHAGTERREAEAGEPVALRLRDEQQREAEARDRAAELREPDHRTNTAARSTWPRSLTVERVAPARRRRLQTEHGEVANACRRPSCQA